MVTKQVAKDKPIKLSKEQSCQLERLINYILQGPIIERIDHVIDCLNTGKPLLVEQKDGR